MDFKTISELIDCLKRIMYDSTTFMIPEKGFYDTLELKNTNFLFIVDINRKGRKKPKFTLQLRDRQHKEYPLLRLDLLGPDHPNPEGDFPLAGQLIPCPHLHIAHPEYGDSIAYPLNEEYTNIYLTEDELADLALVLRKFLQRCNVGNITEYIFDYQAELI